MGGACWRLLGGRNEPLVITATARLVLARWRYPGGPLVPDREFVRVWDSQPSQWGALLGGAELRLGDERSSQMESPSMSELLGLICNGVLVLSAIGMGYVVLAGKGYGGSK